MIREQTTQEGLLSLLDKSAHGPTRHVRFANGSTSSTLFFRWSVKPMASRMMAKRPATFLERTSGCDFFFFF